MQGVGRTIRLPGGGTRTEDGVAACREQVRLKAGVRVVLGSVDSGGA